jgi:CHAT domain-containing protein/Tfp pilus assembly protein PilF
MMYQLSIHLRRLAILAAGAVLIHGARAQTPPGGAAPAAVVRQAGNLVLHQPVERELGPGQTDAFTVDVAAGLFLHVEAEKKGVDVVLVLADPQGKALVTADSPNGAFGHEPASLIADGGGEYQVQVAKSPRSSETGQYRIELTDLHAPTEQDRSRLRAESEFLIAVANDRAGDREKRLLAVAGYQKAAALWHSQHDVGEEAFCLHRLGLVYYNLGELQKALEYYNQALPIRRAVEDRAGEAATLINIGLVYSNLGERQKALNYYNQALPLARAAWDRAGEAVALNRIGAVYQNLGENRKALNYYSQSLLLRRALGDRAGEAGVLNNIGIVYWQVGEMQKALDYFNQALLLKRAVGDRASEASTLDNIGGVYWRLGEAQKALDYYNQTLPLDRAVGDRNGEANTLNRIAVVYQTLGEEQKALYYYNQALPLRRAVGDRNGEAMTLSNIGAAYSDLGEKQKALGYLNQALPLLRAVGDRDQEAMTLTNIGAAYSDLGEKQKALGYLNQALPLLRAVGDRDQEATTMNTVGQVYSALGEKQKALDGYAQALRLAREVSSTPLQGLVLSSLMGYWQADRHAELAIFFGKQAVNQYQQIRQNIQGLEQQLQRSYLATVTKTYRSLAELLIAQGRLAEAEQVLGLLKEQEYFDYVRRDAAEASSVNGHANLNPEETEADKRYREIGDRLAAIGNERGDLLAKKSLTPEETQRLDQLEKDIAVGNANFEKFLGDLAQRFAAKPAMALRVDDLRETQGIMEDLRELPPGTVAIFTLVAEDKFRAILRTSDVQKAYEYPISAADLNRKIADFRQVVMDPELDPRPLAGELYKIIVGPMAADLRQAKAQTLMWSLDGTLRYLPLAALYDGRHYLIEQYRASVMTLASETRLKDRPDAQWKGAGFGVTKAYEDAPALPSVSAELAGIIASKPGDAGVMVGEIKLDGDFTQQSMRDTLRKHYPVVHISSHFRFQAGNETQSFLLLGDGGHLSMADLKTSATMFGGVQLLTLSACNTGMGDGAEVEGFGTLAQRQGAKAVVASLWPVADESTSMLMQRFYRIREASPGQTKLEALREAQLELLRGTTKLAQSAEKVRGVMIQEHGEGKASVEAPRFALDPQAPYAHPYYWAPFFLMGNWL